MANVEIAEENLGHLEKWSQGLIESYHNQIIIFNQAI